MRILFLHQNFPGQFVHLAPALAKMGHQVVALGMERQKVELPGVRYIQHRPAPGATQQGELATQLEGLTRNLVGKFLRAESATRAMEALLKEGFVPDVVYAHSGWGEAMFVKAVFPRARLLVYAEYYYGTEGGDTDFDPEFGRPALRSLMRTQVNNLHLLQGLTVADAGLSPTEFQKSQHPAELQPKISVVHDGIDTAHHVPNAQARISLQSAGLTLRPGDEVVTFVARQLEPYRGYHTFMRALPALLALRPQARVLIVGGDGVSYGAAPPAGTTWKQRFLDEVKGQIDMGRIHFVGMLPHQTLTQLLQVSAVHVYLTYPFVLSWSLLEAMSIGCLIVGSDTAPLREVITDGHNGHLVDFFDPQALAAKVADVLAHRAGMQPLRQAARQTVVERFDLKRVCLPRNIDFVLGH